MGWSKQRQGRHRKQARKQVSNKVAVQQEPPDPVKDSLPWRSSLPAWKLNSMDGIYPLWKVSTPADFWSGRLILNKYGAINKQTWQKPLKCKIPDLLVLRPSYSFELVSKILVQVIQFKVAVMEFGSNANEKAFFSFAPSYCEAFHGNYASSNEVIKPIRSATPHKKALKKVATEQSQTLKPSGPNQPVEQEPLG